MLVLALAQKDLHIADAGMTSSVQQSHEEASLHCLLLSSPAPALEGCPALLCNHCSCGLGSLAGTAFLCSDLETGLCIRASQTLFALPEVAKPLGLVLGARKKLRPFRSSFQFWISMPQADAFNSDLSTAMAVPRTSSSVIVAVALMARRYV